MFYIFFTAAEFWAWYSYQIWLYLIAVLQEPPTCYVEPYFWLCT